MGRRSDFRRSRCRSWLRRGCWGRLRRGRWRRSRRWCWDRRRHDLALDDDDLRIATGSEHACDEYQRQDAPHQTFTTTVPAPPSCQLKQALSSASSAASGPKPRFYRVFRIGKSAFGCEDEIWNRDRFLGRNWASALCFLEVAAERPRAISVWRIGCQASFLAKPSSHRCVRREVYLNPSGAKSPMELSNSSGASVLTGVAVAGSGVSNW